MKRTRNDDDEDNFFAKPVPSKESDGSGSEDENPDAKRVRMTKSYLKAVRESRDQKSGEDSDGDEESINARLRDEVRSATRTRSVASLLSDENGEHKLQPLCVLRGHKRSCTSCCLSNDNTSLFSGSKDSSVIHWDLETQKKVRVFSDSPMHILSLSISSDDLYLVSGSLDSKIRVYDVRSSSCVKTLLGHKSAVTGLSIQPNSHTLFSSGLDGVVKVWSLNDLCFAETLFGHQDSVLNVDSLSKDQAVSVGRDKSVRLWKLATGTQLVFNSSRSLPLESISMISDRSFVSGSEDGVASLWHAGKRKPVSSITEAHGMGNMITSLKAIRNSDFVMSGSCDGLVRGWKIDRFELREILKIPVLGFVNDIDISNEPSCPLLACAVGQEHRLGRWKVMKGARNGTVVYKFPNLLEQQEQLH